MEGLMIELSDLSRRNDELMTGKDADLVVIRDLDAQLKEYKRKYEQAKTELRSVKGVSTSVTSHLQFLMSYCILLLSHFTVVPPGTKVR
jgi:hypothetical protein